MVTTHSPSSSKQPRQADGSQGGRRPLRERTVAVLPTLLTLGNLLSGFAAVLFASRPVEASSRLAFGWRPLTFAALAVFLGMIFDGLDGRVARLTKQTSSLGEQLDSMADMVTFGVAPAFIAVQMVGQLIAVGTPYIGDRGDMVFGRIVFTVAGIYVACAGLRLARFNSELKNGDDGVASHLSFKGLPTPGAAGAVVAMVFLHEHYVADLPADHWLINAAGVGMVLLMALVSFAMVSRLDYIHVGNRYLRGQARFSTLALVIALLLIMTVFLQETMAAVFGAYACSAPLMWALHKLLPRGEPASRGE